MLFFGGLVFGPAGTKGSTAGTAHGGLAMKNIASNESKDASTRGPWRWSILFGVGLMGDEVSVWRTD